MTEEEEDSLAVDLAIKRAEESSKEIERLVNKYVGSKCLEYGRAIKDKCLKVSWYAEQISVLSWTEGMNEIRRRKCKNAETETYKKYDQIEKDIKQVLGQLVYELQEAAHAAT